MSDTIADSTDLSPAPNTDGRVEEEVLPGWMRDTPQMRALIEQERIRYERSVPVPCAWGWCTNDVDPVDGTVLSGFGPVECPCENLPGWRASRVAGRAKPQVPVKVRGRHGSRVQRSSSRHMLAEYDIDDFEWLSPRTVAG